MRKMIDNIDFGLFKMPISIIFIAIYPGIALYSYNVDQIILVDILRSIAVSLLASFVGYIAAYIVFQDRIKAATLTGLCIMLMFSYGHIYGIIKSTEVLGVVVGRHRYLGVIWLSIFLVGIIKISKSHPKTNTLKLYSLIFGALLALPLISILTNTSNLTFGRGEGWKESLNLPRVFRENDENYLPDIYYIVPDSYLRQDVLASDYGISNKEFLDFLTAQGFFVADQSTSNYMWTHQSLASSLNMSYLHDLIPVENPGKFIEYDQHIRHNLLRAELERIGYSTVAFATGWAGSELFDADIILTPNLPESERLIKKGYLNEYESLLLHTTVVQILLDLDQAKNIPVTRYITERMDARFHVQRDIVLGLFDNLELVPTIPGPKFVFAHIISPCFK